MLLGLLLLLPGCRMFDPEPLEFASDPRILRGRYEGVIDTRVTSHTLALSADASALGAGDGRAVVQLWDAHTAQPFRSLGQLGESSHVDAVAITADGSRVASTRGGKTQFWEVSTGEVTQTFATGEKLALASGGTLLATGTWDAPRVVLRKVETGERLRGFTGPGDSLETFTFSADGSLLAALFYTSATTASGARPFYVRVWKVEDGDERLAGTRPNHEYPQLAFSADGRSLAFVTGQSLSVREVTTGRVTATLASPYGATHLALSPDGAQLAVGSLRPEGGSNVKIFGIATGTNPAA